jgi:PAS domain S-box-containing protein
VSSLSDSEQAPRQFAFPAGGVFLAAPDAVVVMDADGYVQDWNPAAERIFGYRREDTVGREVAELIVPGPLRSAHRNALRRYVENQESVIIDRRLELTAVRSDGSDLPIELTVTRVPDVEPPLFAGFVRDLSTREAANRETGRLQQRMAFLAQAGLVLDRSLNYEETLRRLAELTVPELAQLTVIDLADESGMIATAVAAAFEPDRAQALEAMRRAHPLAPTSTHPVIEVLRSQQPILLPAMSEAFLRSIAQGSEHFELMRRLGYHSAIVVPLIARARVLGALSLLRMDDGPSYDRDDLVLAEELARHAALAIDNARLFETSQHIAQTLQRSLLPQSLPEIPGVRIVGRYRAAEQGQEVGGDFYDAFTIEPGRWGIAIGDVGGKGPHATALTALARYTIRALGDAAPGRVLEQLNRALLRELGERSDERFLTALFAHAQRDGEQLALELAAGGHPPPLVLRSSGEVESVAVSGPLVGLSEASSYDTKALSLHPGDALLLYTDGLTDAQAPARILSEADLVELLGRSHGLDAEQLAAFLEQQATQGADARDDIALLVLQRTH